MHHLKPVTRSPRPAQFGLSVEVKLTFISNVIDAALPLFADKDPQNPLPGDGTGDGTGA